MTLSRANSLGVSTSYRKTHRVPVQGRLDGDDLHPKLEHLASQAVRESDDSKLGGRVGREAWKRYSTCTGRRGKEEKNTQAMIVVVSVVVVIGR